jgi:LPXTG-motif cell wall-anchored protein
MFAGAGFNNRRTGWLRRFRGLVTLASTTVLILLIALPIQAGTLTIELPYDVIVEDPGDVILLKSETIPSPMVGEVCSVTAEGENNSSVHPGNNVEITSANTVTLVGVEDYEDKVTTTSGELTLGEEITVTLLLATNGDGVYSAELDIVLNCQAATTTTTTTTTTTPTTVPNEVLPIVVTAPTTTLAAKVLPTEVTATTVPTEVLAETLPFTGSNDLGWLVLAGGVLTLGSILVLGSRRQES